MVGVNIVEVRSVVCPRCGSEGRVTVRTPTGVLSRCYLCDDEAAPSATFGAHSTLAQPLIAPM